MNLMNLTQEQLDSLKISPCCAGAPYHVETIKYGPQYTYMRESPPQVCDARGVVAVVGRNGGVFMPDMATAEAVCAAANAGLIAMG